MVLNIQSFCLLRIIKNLLNNHYNTKGLKNLDKEDGNVITVIMWSLLDKLCRASFKIWAALFRTQNFFVLDLLLVSKWRN